MILAAAAAVAITVLAGCSSGSSGSSPSSGSSSSVAPDASPQTIASALGCVPSGAPSTASESAGASSNPISSGFAGAVQLKCSHGDLKYSIVTFTSVQNKMKTLTLIHGFVQGSGLAVCSGPQKSWIVANDLDVQNKLTPDQRAAQSKVMTSAKNALGCRVLAIGRGTAGSSGSASSGSVAPPSSSASTSAPTTGPLTGSSQPATVAAKLGCSVQGQGSGSGQVEDTCTKDGLMYEIDRFSDADALRNAGQFLNSKGRSFCSRDGGLWNVTAQFNTASDKLTSSQQATQKKQMGIAHAALDCTVHS